MELTNEFSVAAPVEEVWPLLTDIERIAPCVPGFKLTGSENGEYRGTMKEKVGAVTTSYDCVIRFVEVDDANHRAVIEARGKETKGQGGVTANIISNVTSEGDKTKASVVTDLNVTGRVAQFGRGILADVSDRLVKQFVKQLEAKILAPKNAGEGDGGDAAQGASASASASAGSGSGGAAGSAWSAQTSGGGAAAEADSEPLDLLSVAGGPLVKRVAPAAAVLAVLAFVILQVRARSGR
jgi:carbon monoxide dehydrogenase subunit G